MCVNTGGSQDRDGQFHPLAVKALEFAGDWLKTNGEAIYSTRAMPRAWNDTISGMVRYTVAKGSGGVIYATVLSGFGSKPLASPASLVGAQI